MLLQKQKIDLDSKFENDVESNDNDNDARKNFFRL